MKDFPTFCVFITELQINYKTSLKQNKGGVKLLKTQKNVRKL